MAPDTQTYRVNASQDRVRIDPGKAGEIQFTITNSGDEPLDTGLKLNIDGDIRPEWCQVVTDRGEARELSLGTKESVQASVRIVVPDNARVGASKVSLTSYWVEKPETVFTTGPDVTVATGGKPPFPWKTVIIASSVVVLLAVILLIALSGGPPQVGFRADPLSGFAPLKVQFTDASEGKPDKWQWNFGDGSPEATTQNPEHVYTEPGKYAVMLKASSGSKSDANLVPNMIEVFSPVKAAFEPVPAEGESPLEVAFRNNSTGEVDKFAWEFGDGKTSDEREPTHTYTADRDRTFKVVLQVTGAGAGNTNRLEQSITVHPKGKASFRAQPTIGEVPLAVQFDDRSTNARGWKWNFGDVASGNANMATVPNPKHTFTKRGTYKVTLEIQGGAKSTQTIQVFDKPTVKLTATKAKLGGIRILVIGSAWSIKWATTGDVASGVLDFGDGRKHRLTGKQLRSGAVTHTYASPGARVVKLVLKGRGGSTVSAQRRVAATWKAMPGVRVHDIKDIKGTFRKDLRLKK